MKRIINGKFYDTEKAELLYKDRQNKRNYYLTKNGTFFVHYEKVNKIELVTEEYMKGFFGSRTECYEIYCRLWGEPEEG